MRALIRLYDSLIVALATIAGALLACVFIFIIYDVVLRNLLISPPAWTVPGTEMSLLYITMLAAPWLVRTRGHVVVELLREAMSPVQRRRLETVVYAFGVLLGIVLTWAAIDLWIDAYQTGEEDYRAIDIPRTVIYAPMVIGFFLVTCEFLRLLLGHGTLYSERTGQQDSV